MLFRRNNPALPTSSETKRSSETILEVVKAIAIHQSGTRHLKLAISICTYYTYFSAFMPIL